MEDDHNQVVNVPQDQRSSIELEWLFGELFNRWPNLKGTKVEEADRKIKEEMAEAEIKVVSFPVTVKFRYDCILRSDRVWLFVDDSGIVQNEPYTR